MSIIIKAEPYGSSGDCEYSLSRALSDAERAHCQSIAADQQAWCEIYSFHARMLNDDEQDSDSPLLHFIDPHPLIIPEIQAYLESLQ
jgi:hypothetical protein